MSQCCVLCTLARPACSRSAGEPVASVNVRLLAEHASVAVLGGRSVLQCSARAAASEYCPLELHAEAKFVLITNRKSHMSFRLVPNLMTLDDLDRRNSPNRRVISPNSVTFGAD